MNSREKKLLAADQFAGAVVEAGYNLDQDGVMSYMMDEMGYALDSFNEGGQGYEILQSLKKEGALKDVKKITSSDDVEGQAKELSSMLITQHVNSGEFDGSVIKAAIMEELVDSFGCKTANRVRKHVARIISDRIPTMTKEASLQRLAHFSVMLFKDHKSYVKAMEALSSDASLDVLEGDVFYMTESNAIVFSPEYQEEISAVVDKAISSGGENITYNITKFAAIKTADDMFAPEHDTENAGDEFGMDRKQDLEEKTDEVTLDLAKSASEGLEQYPNDLDLAFMYANNSFAKRHGDEMAAAFTVELKDAVNKEKAKRDTMSQGLLENVPAEKSDVGVVGSKKTAASWHEEYTGGSNPDYAATIRGERCWVIYDKISRGWIVENSSHEVLYDAKNAKDGKKWAEANVGKTTSSKRTAGLSGQWECPQCEKYNFDPDYKSKQSVKCESCGYVLPTNSFLIKEGYKKTADSGNYRADQEDREREQRYAETDEFNKAVDEAEEDLFEEGLLSKRYEASDWFDAFETRKWGWEELENHKKDIREWIKAGFTVDQYLYWEPKFGSDVQETLNEMKYEGLDKDGKSINPENTTASKVKNQDNITPDFVQKVSEQLDALYSGLDEAGVAEMHPKDIADYIVSNLTIGNLNKDQLAYINEEAKRQVKGSASGVPMTKETIKLVRSQPHVYGLPDEAKGWDDTKIKEWFYHQVKFSNKRKASNVPVPPEVGSYVIFPERYEEAGAGQTGGYSYENPPEDITVELPAGTVGKVTQVEVNPKPIKNYMDDGEYFYGTIFVDVIYKGEPIPGASVSFEDWGEYITKANPAQAAQFEKDWADAIVLQKKGWEEENRLMGSKRKAGSDSEFGLVKSSDKKPIKISEGTRGMQVRYAPTVGWVVDESNIEIPAGMYYTTGEEHNGYKMIKDGRATYLVKLGSSKGQQLRGSLRTKASQWTRACSTEEQEQAMAKLERTLKKLNKSIQGGTTIGKSPQTVVVDILGYQTSDGYINADGSVEIRRTHVNPGSVAQVRKALGLDKDDITAPAADSIPESEVEKAVDAEEGINAQWDSERVQAVIKRASKKTASNSFTNAIGAIDRWALDNKKYDIVDEIGETLDQNAVKYIDDLEEYAASELYRIIIEDAVAEGYQEKTASGDGIPPNESPDWPSGKDFDGTLKGLKDVHNRSGDLGGANKVEPKQVDDPPKVKEERYAWGSDISNVQRDIEREKQKLIAKYKSKGLYENFGQNEVRKLEDKYSDFRYKRDGVWDAIRAFSEWAMNFTGKELSDANGRRASLRTKRTAAELYKNTKFREDLKKLLQGSKKTAVEQTVDLKKVYTAEEIAEKHGVSVEQINKAFEVGIKIEYEHTKDEEVARSIASHHLWEHADYYDNKEGLPAMEKKLEK